jgi:hypothetical protein
MFIFKLLYFLAFGVISTCTHGALSQYVRIASQRVDDCILLILRPSVMLQPCNIVFPADGQIRPKHLENVYANK